MTRVSIPIRMLRWAIERSDVSEDRLHNRFDKLAEWLTGDRSPTLKQLENFAKATHTPLGYLFLSEPPKEPVPIPDYRTIADRPIGQPSANLLDILYLSQQRQEWYREYARSTGEQPLTFVGSVKHNNSVVKAAAIIRNTLGFDLEQRQQCRSWIEALRQFVAQADDIGVLVMVSGVVGSNNRRKLDPEEFRGFALSDSLAPLVFINGADTKSAQMFTLAHELAHIWLGETALSDVTPRTKTEHAVERWCNQVAAELLVPMDLIHDAYKPNESLRNALDRLAYQFKVSTLVILRRLLDIQQLSQTRFWAAYEDELQRIRDLTPAASGGGDYYRTTTARVSPRFARAMVVAAWEGRATFTEAYRLLGCRKTSTLRELGHSVGVDV